MRPIAFVTLGAFALLWIYDAFTLRPLFADGFLYLLRLLERETFWLEAPARRTVEFVRQLPVLAALKLGIGGVDTLAVVFGLSLHLLPLTLTALCWPALPRERKALFVFPLLHYVAGTLGAAFGPIVEGPAAAAYFWLLFLLLLFRPARHAWLALVAALGLGTALLHEGIVLLAPVLAAAAASRGRREEKRAARIVFASLALWFVLVVALQARFILDPSHPENRMLYFTALVSLWWLFGLWGSLNLPALFGIVGLLLLLAVWLWRLTRRGALRAPSLHGYSLSNEEARRVSASSAGRAAVEAGRAQRAPTWAAPVSLLLAAFGIACLGAVIHAIAGDLMYAAQAQLNARNHAILISLPLALVVLALVLRPALARKLPFRPAAILCAWLAAAAALWHVEAARRWSDYVGVFREVLREHRGLVVWEDLLLRLPPGKARLVEGMSHFWIEPTMSIVLAPGGQVATIVAARRAARWYPFDATKPAELPRARFWNYDAYLAALKK